MKKLAAWRNENNQLKGVTKKLKGESAAIGGENGRKWHEKWLWRGNLAKSENISTINVFGRNINEAAAATGEGEMENSEEINEKLEISSGVAVKMSAERNEMAAGSGIMNLKKRNKT